MDSPFLILTLKYSHFCITYAFIVHNHTITYQLKYQQMFSPERTRKILLLILSGFYIIILQSSSYRPYEAQGHTVRFVSFSTCYPDISQTH